MSVVALPSAPARPTTACSSNGSTDGSSTQGVDDPAADAEALRRPSATCCATSSRCSPAPRFDALARAAHRTRSPGSGRSSRCSPIPPSPRSWSTVPAVPTSSAPGGSNRSSLDLDAAAIVHLVERVVAPLGLRLDRSSPMVDARLADGSRLHAVIPPLAVDGPCVTIRRFGTRAVPLDEFGVDGAAATFLRWTVAAGWNLLVAGATSAGKTTLLNALLAVDPARRAHRHHRGDGRAAARATARRAARGPAGERRGRRRGRRVRALVRAALRMRPDRLVVGEVRGRRGARHAPGAQHRSRRLDVAPSTPTVPSTRSPGWRRSCCSPIRGCRSRAVRAQVAASIDAVVFVAARSRWRAAGRGDRRGRRSPSRRRATAVRPTRPIASCRSRASPVRRVVTTPRRVDLDARRPGRPDASVIRRADPRARDRGATHVCGVDRRGSPRRGRGPSSVTRSAIAVARARTPAALGWSRAARRRRALDARGSRRVLGHRRGRGRARSPPRLSPVLAGAGRARGRWPRGRSPCVLARSRRERALHRRAAAGALEQVAAELRGGGTVAAAVDRLAAGRRRGRRPTSGGCTCARSSGCRSPTRWPVGRPSTTCPGCGRRPARSAVAATMGGRAADAIDGLASSLAASARRGGRGALAVGAGPLCRRWSWARRRSATSRSRPGRPGRGHRAGRHRCRDGSASWSGSALEALAGAVDPAHPPVGRMNAGLWLPWVLGVAWGAAFALPFARRAAWWPRDGAGRGRCRAHWRCVRWRGATRCDRAWSAWWEARSDGVVLARGAFAARSARRPGCRRRARARAARRARPARRGGRGRLHAVPRGRGGGALVARTGRGRASTRSCAAARLGLDFESALDAMAPHHTPAAAAGRRVARHRSARGAGRSRARPTGRRGSRRAATRRAEAHARRIPVRLLFPLVFLVLPAFVLLTVVPGLAAGLGRI